MVHHSRKAYGDTQSIVHMHYTHGSSPWVWDKICYIGQIGHFIGFQNHRGSKWVWVLIMWFFKWKNVKEKENIQKIQSRMLFWFFFQSIMLFKVCVQTWRLEQSHHLCH